MSKGKKGKVSDAGKWDEKLVSEQLKDVSRQMKNDAILYISPL